MDDHVGATLVRVAVTEALLLIFDPVAHCVGRDAKQRGRNPWQGPPLRLATGPPLPDAVVDTIGTTIFGIADVWLTGLGGDAVIVGGARGTGLWLSAAPVALVAGLMFENRLVHDLEPAT